MPQEVGYVEGQALVRDCICAECGGELVLPWNYPSGYLVRCGRSPEHNGMVKRGKPVKERLAHMGLSAEEIEKEMNQREENMTSKALEKYHGVTALTQPEAAEIVSTLWPKAPQVEVLKAAIVCKQYGLNPLAKHLFLIPFGNTWAMVMGIRATRLIASRTRRYSYADGPRLMTAKEQEEIYGEVDPVNLVALTILKDEHGNRAPGYGKWPKAEKPYGTDKGNSQANMAMIRSERSAFERLIPGEMPSLDVVSEEYVDREAEDRGTLVVDSQTGEILEGEAELFPEDTPVPAPGGPVLPQGVPSEAKPAPQGGPGATGRVSKATFALLRALWAKGSGLANYELIDADLARAWKARQERLGLTGSMTEAQCQDWLVDIRKEQGGK